MSLNPNTGNDGTRATASILIIEDNPSLAETYKAFLGNIDSTIRIADSAAAAQAKIAEEQPCLILLDINLPDSQGTDLLDILRRDCPETKVIVITAHGSVQLAVEAMRRGAEDFLMKPFGADRLVASVHNALELAHLSSLVQVERQRPPQRADDNDHFGDFIGSSEPMQALYQMIRDAAPSRASVFIVGESGTGKELTAEQIHRLSPRSARPFVALNCAAIPANLIESEIFGHVRGAFTGATKDHDGAALRADGGTLFLDEICDMPLDLQPKLLRFIQTGQIAPVGSGQTRKVDVRFVCATNKNPWQSVQDGEFREDLYYRLHVVPIHVPPLRARGVDVIKIANALMRRFAAEEGKGFRAMSDKAREVLLDHSWPGNVRELSNVIQSAVVLHEGDILTETMLKRVIGPPHIPHTLRPASLQPNNPPSVVPMTTATVSVVPTDIDQVSQKGIKKLETLEEAERRAVEHALFATGGHVVDAAEQLGIGSATLYRRLKQWAIDPADYRGRRRVSE